MKINPAYARTPVTNTPAAQKAWKTATDFEAHFLKTFLEQAFSNLGGDGPLGASGTGGDAWRSMLIDEHAKGMVAQGSIGIAPAVYREMARRNGGGFDATR
jgi:peptidoglycan hydrolase FlgJ